MDLDILRSLFFGIYKIKQSKTYTEEHLDENADFVIPVAPKNNEILRCRIQSRHSNATHYHAWYCQCRSGARTLGCCGHITSVVWYLLYARLRDFQPSFGRKRIVEAIEYI